jgi:hypothetical protein
MNRLIELLRRKRTLLLKAYVIHVGWFASTCAFAASGVVQIGLTTSIWLTLLTMPPVFLYMLSVHKACKAIDAHAKTTGWVPIAVFTFVLTPLESTLILPLTNLSVSRRILRNWDSAQAASHVSENG